MDKSKFARNISILIFILLPIMGIVIGAIEKSPNISTFTNEMLSMIVLGILGIFIAIITIKHILEYGKELNDKQLGSELLISIVLIVIVAFVISSNSQALIFNIIKLSMAISEINLLIIIGLSYEKNDVIPPA